MSDTFEQYRGMLFGIAYRMVGSVMEAEDIVQDAFLRYQRADPDTIDSPQAYLRTIVTRLSLDHLKSAKVQRETYIGPWLPEPILTENQPQASNPVDKFTETESLSMAFLLLLESLSPIERAVFLLREVFDYSYKEIAQMVNKSEANCRQAFRHAKQHIVAKRPRFQAEPEAHEQMLLQFMTAVQSGDLEGLKSLLAEDVVSTSDGGGKKTAATRPLLGPDAVAKFFIGLAKNPPPNLFTQIRQMNGRAAVVLMDGEDIDSIIALEVMDGRIQNITAVRNPDKLGHLKSNH